MPVLINRHYIDPLTKQSGFIVLGPDYFFGDPVQDHSGEAGFDQSAWAAKSKKQADECVPRWLEAVKEKYGL